MDSRDDASTITDITPSSGRQQQPPLPWITFTGSSDESPGDFIQMVHRLAFQQGRANDDRWMAQYASTCFNDDALSWYSGLESDTRESWAMLRLALLRHYPPRSTRFMGSPFASRTSASDTKSYERVGIIKVLDKNSSPLGFVSFDRISGTTTITQDMKKSVWMGVSGSCLGAALLPSARGSSDIAPKELLGIEKEFNIGSGGWRSRNVPSPSPKCSGSRGPSASRNSYVEIATWVFAVCEEGEKREARGRPPTLLVKPCLQYPGTSPTCLTKFNTTPEKRRAAAVWYYTKGESELRIKWAGGECELGGFIHSDTSGEIHFHRLTDMQPDKVKEYIEEDRVRGVPEYRVRTHVFSASGMSSVLIADLVLEQVITPHLSAKLFVVMNTPAAAPNQLESGPESDIVPQVAGTIPWITFGGLPNESSSAFVQCLQRIGFQQGRGRDDEWMAEYAATCFEGDALSWYAQLDDEIQESWKKLRAKLLQKYPPIAGSSAPPFTIPYPATVPAVTAGGVTSSTNPSQPQGYVGRIEVMANHTVARGYLSFNATSGIGITTDKDKAVIVSVPSGKASGILQLNMVGRDGCHFAAAELPAEFILGPPSSTVQIVYYPTSGLPC
ncbi:hypothetical protein FRC04_004948 [Tulasnella sp. 424]|nr:hypothetical protein FRC04_004948 [Tulasnella sp. 424]